MRRAFAELGAEVVAIDEGDDGVLAARLAEELGRGVDLVFERYSLARTTACRFALERGLPHVLEVNAPLADAETCFRDALGGERGLSRETWLFRETSCLLAVSPEIEDYARRAGRAGPILVRPNGVDPRAFRPRESALLRARLVPEGAFCIGFHGSLSRANGADLLVRTTAALSRQVPVHLLLVGCDADAAELAGNLPPGLATLVPWQRHADVGAWVACFDALPLVRTSGAPESPLALAEAMASGVVPVVPAGPLARAVRHGADALVYAAGDLPSLAGALRRLANEPELRARLSSAAVESARRRTWTNLASDVLEWSRAHRASGVR
jgi:glycosyltransferase involved in cell wall biosynthesis